MTVARVSQSVLEVVRRNDGVKARVSQSVIEVLRIRSNNNVRVSQSVIEVVRVNGVETPIGGAVQPMMVIVCC